MPSLLQDVRFAARLLFRSPAFAVVAGLTLGLGIGANTAIFSVVHAFLLRPLPYPEADRLVMVWQDLRGRGGPAQEWATPGHFFDWQAATHLFEGVAAVQGWNPALTGGAVPEPLIGEQVSRGYFDVLGIGPSVGRTFRSDEDVPNAPRVAVLGHGLWQRRFGGDPRIVGQSIVLGGEAHEVVGIMPPTFRPAVVPTAEVWRPRRLSGAAPSRGAVILCIVARVRSGLSADEIASAAAVLGAQLAQAHPDTDAGSAINIVPLHEQIVGDLRPGLLVLLGAVGFVLLIACANIANLLLARASARSREIAVRMALGAARRRIVRQLLTESLLLAMLGGALGVMLGVWGVEGLVAIVPDGAPRVDEIRLHPMVLVFAAALTVLTGVLFGLMPALHASHAALTPALHEGGRGTAGTSGRRARRGLIVAEIAIALVLLVGSGLLMRTLLRLQAVDLGFQPSGVLTGFVVPPATKYSTSEQLVAFYDRLLERISVVPGVDRAALSSVTPLGGDSDMDVLIEGRPLPRGSADSTTTWYRLISAGYFEAMHIELLAGRFIEPREAAPALMVNDTGARRFWPGENALGKRVRFSVEDDAPWFTVVGVVGDVKMRGAKGEPRTEMYVPYWQFTERGTNVVVKGRAPELLAAPLREAVRDVDPDLPISGLTPMSDAVSRSVAEPRFVAVLVGAFAVLALTLAALGIYGVMAYTVAQRTAEIGVRMALGAGWRDILGLVVGEGLAVAGVGVAIGLAGAIAVGRGLETMLFEVEPGDPTTFLATTAILLAVAGVASLIPALRATHVDPVMAIKQGS